MPSFAKHSSDGVNPYDGYSVPQEAGWIFREGVLQNALIAKYLPPETLQAAKKIRFIGSDRPSVPVNWRIAESVASVHALEAAVLGVLLAKKYGIEAPEAEIDTSVLLARF